MRCPTCSDTPHPGFVVWREIETHDGVFRRVLRPCSTCGGSGVASCCDDAVGCWRETVNGSDETA
jgi:hypothetical protein